PSRHTRPDSDKRSYTARNRHCRRPGCAAAYWAPGQALLQAGWQGGAWFCCCRIDDQSLLLTGGLVDANKLFDPLAPLGMLKGHELVVRPVEVIRERGYLLVELREGVAYDSPDRSGSTSKACWQCGQTTCNRCEPLPLSRL